MEVTIFNYVDSILFDKKYLHCIDSSENTYNAFMTNRWISMYSSEAANIVNETTNQLWSVLSSKKDHYTFLINVFPKVSKKRINYLKKSKKEKPTQTKTSNIDLDELLAKRLEVSKREIMQLELFKREIMQLELPTD